ncbi:hypothetical protein ACE1B6_12250 [Aerosakkonemataceae cyanobacterium BLCC-F154]|uniref:Lipoprotein n=1 Tax=Floridaenema fluviatile BLCC-F154 TaxID=3153640 RepID=A0ABV4YBX6_9CYAN
MYNKLMLMLAALGISFSACASMQAPCREAAALAATVSVSDDLSRLLAGNSIDKAAFLQKVRKLEEVESVPAEKSAIGTFSTIISADGKLIPAFERPTQQAYMQLTERVNSLRASCKEQS